MRPTRDGEVGRPPRRHPGAHHRRAGRGGGQLPRTSCAQLDAGYRFSPDGGRTFPFRGAGVRIPTLAEVLEAFPGVRGQRGDQGRSRAGGASREVVRRGGRRAPRAGRRRATRRPRPLRRLPGARERLGGGAARLLPPPPPARRRPLPPPGGRPAAPRAPRGAPGASRRASSGRRTPGTSPSTSGRWTSEADMRRLLEWGVDGDHHRPPRPPGARAHERTGRPLPPGRRRRGEAPA